MPTRTRFRFAKTGDLIWVSHRDFLQVLERAARVANLPLEWTQGFNPRPRIHVALALAVGVVGTAEVLEVDCAEPVDPAELTARWQAALPVGCVLGAAQVVAPGRPAARAVGARYRVRWPSAVDGLAAALDGLLRRRSAPVDRRLKAGTRSVDVRHWLEGGRVDDPCTLAFELRVDDGTARPDEVLRAMGLAADVVAAAAVERVALVLADE